MTTGKLGALDLLVFTGLGVDLNRRRVIPTDDEQGK